MEKSYIWTLPTRIFHWAFVLFILIAYLTDDEDVMFYHLLAGYIVFILATFRVTWGLFGPKYSTFTSFELNKQSVKNFIKAPFSSSQYIGHNPLASWVMIAMIVLPFIIVITGTLDLGFQEKNGLFAFLGSMGQFKTFEKLHELFANALLFFIGLHLIGILLDRIFHKKYETLISIFTGYKMTSHPESIKLNVFQKLLFVIFMALLVWFIFYMFFASSNLFFTAK